MKHVSPQKRLGQLDIGVNVYFKDTLKIMQRDLKTKLNLSNSNPLQFIDY